MNLEQTIKDTIVSESHDLDGRLQQLVRAGLMPANTIPILRKAIGKVQGGMTLQGAERDVMANFINSMMFIVLGDDAIFNRARTGAKSYAVEETDLEENAKIVAHLSKRYGDNIRKSHVMSAAKDFGVDASKLSKAVRKHLDKTMLPEAKEKTEYDYEGDMAMGQLKSIIANSQRMHDMLSDDTNLPEWVQSKITLAEDYISTASNYMQGEMNEEQIDEISKKTLGSYVKKASGAEQPKNVMSPKNVPLTKIAAYQGDSETGHFGKRFNQHTYDKAERLRKNRETGIKRAVDKLTKEEVEITEASVADVAKTAHLHVRAGKHDSIHTAIQSAVNTHFPSSVHSSVTRKKVAAQALSRIQSMNNSKMTKEETENLDELSKKTLGSYVKKASHDVATRAAATSRYGEREEVARKSGDYDSARKNSKIADKAFNKGWKRRANMAKAVDKLTKEDVELDEGNTTPEIKKAYADLIKTPSGSSERKTAIRHYKSLRQNLAKEEVEQVDEISKAMAGRYVKKAAASIDLTAWRQGHKEAGAGNPSKQLEKKLTKRHKGIETAVKKLTKEDIDVARSMHESYKMKFDAALEYYNIKSPSELGEDKRKEFFNHVDQEFKKGDN